ncbi:hypothetical protein D9M68_768100 [compost metagenome]
MRAVVPDGQVHRPQPPAHDLPEGAAADGLIRGTQLQEHLAQLCLRSHQLEILGKGVGCSSSQRITLNARALLGAMYPNDGLLPIEIIQAQSSHLGCPQTILCEQQNDGAIADRAGSFILHPVQQLTDRFPGRAGRQRFTLIDPAGPNGRRQSWSALFVLLQETKESSQVVGVGLHRGSRQTITASLQGKGLIDGLPIEPTGIAPLRCDHPKKLRGSTAASADRHR